MKRLIALGATAALLAAPAHASITVLGFEFERGLDAFATSATFVEGSVSQVGTVACPDSLTGADIDTGCFNVGFSGQTTIRLDFATAFGNEAGDDFVFTDGRFSNDALQFSLDGTNFFTLAADDFTDTGVNSTIRGTGLNFDVFAVAVDFSDFGFMEGQTWSSLFIRGVGESDPVLLGSLNAGIDGAVPVPAAAPLMLAGLAAFGAAKRRSKS